MHKSASSLSHVGFRLKATELLHAHISSHAGLDGEAGAEFLTAQIAGIRRNLPLILAANTAGLLIAIAALKTSAGLIAWGALALPALVAALLCLPRSATSSAPGDMAKLLRRVEVSAVLIGLCWAALSLCGLNLAGAADSALWTTALLAVAGLLAYGFAPVPSAAILSMGIIISAHSVPALLARDWPSATLFLGGLSYFAILTLLILARYRCLLELAHGEEERRRHAETVALLMRDFDSGSNDWLWQTDAQGRLVRATHGLAQWTGCDLEDLQGRRLGEIGGLPEHLGPWQSLCQLMSEHRDIVDVAVPVKRGKEKRWWQLSARPIIAANGDFTGYRGVGRDVTEAFQARAELVQAKEMAERASQAKSQFLNVLSHELRTPLNAIIGFSEIMAEEREGPVGSGSYKDYAVSIVESSRQLQRIINDILDASRIDSGRFKLLEQEVDAAELAQVALRSCRELAQRSNVDLTGDYRSIRAEIKGDLVRLKQILENLLTNAIKFTPALGTVDLSVRDETDGGLSFIVKDNGIGIEKKDLELVFEPFVQVDGGMSRHFAGTGLGLSIARRLARAHGGDITLISATKQGTTAIFRLPADRVIREAAAAPVAEDVAAA